MGKDNKQSEHDRILFLEKAVEEIFSLLNGPDAGREQLGEKPFVVNNYTFPIGEETQRSRGNRPQAYLRHCQSAKIHTNTGNSDDTVNVTLNHPQTARGRYQVFSASANHSGAAPSGADTTDWVGSEAGVSKGPIKVKRGECLHLHYKNPNHQRDSWWVPYKVT